MKLLYIAPLPPPITGHSLVSKVLYDDLIKRHEIEVIDLSKDSFKEGVDGIKRIFEVLSIIKEVRKKNKKSDCIYLTISESLAGNLKDLFIYLVCFRNLSKMYIHLHGGSIKRLLWDKHRLLAKINYFFIKKMGGAIISGESHKQIFSHSLPKEKIYIVPNFAQNYLFVSIESIISNFSSEEIRILYMSNLIPKKGYMELFNAFVALPDSVKKRIRLDFAGAFDSESSKISFVSQIAEYKNVTYHGLVDDITKKGLFERAHIFCLPTLYFEGQPISILEAYATGCVVVTTGQSGIKDIFEDMQNGYEIEPGSIESIKNTIISIIDKKDEMLAMAIHNYLKAYEQYRSENYTSAIQNILQFETSFNCK